MAYADQNLLESTGLESEDTENFDEQFTVQTTLDNFTALHWTSSPGRYAPTGQIVWHSRKGKHGTHFFALSELFSTADEARVVAEEEAKTWAERRLVDVRP